MSLGPVLYGPNNFCNCMYNTDAYPTCSTCGSPKFRVDTQGQVWGFDRRRNCKYSWDYKNSLYLYDGGWKLDLQGNWIASDAVEAAEPCWDMVEYKCKTDGHTRRIRIEWSNMHLTAEQADDVLLQLRRKTFLSSRSTPASVEYKAVVQGIPASLRIEWSRLRLEEREADKALEKLRGCVGLNSREADDPTRFEEVE